MKEIRLGDEAVALVDDSDYDWLTVFSWCVQRCQRHSYAVTSVLDERNGKRRQRTVRMHRLIMQASRDQKIDHRNGDGLDNRRSNLRLCTHAQNCANRRTILNRTGLKGVRLNSGSRNSWSASICVLGRTIHLGSFTKALLAAEAYDVAALKYFGKFAATNHELAVL